MPRRYKRSGVFIRKIGQWRYDKDTREKVERSSDYERGKRWRVYSVHAGDKHPGSVAVFGTKKEALECAKRWREGKRRRKK